MFESRSLATGVLKSGGCGPIAAQAVFAAGGSLPQRVMTNGQSGTLTVLPGDAVLDAMMAQSSRRCARETERHSPFVFPCFFLWASGVSVTKNCSNPCFGCLGCLEICPLGWSAGVCPENYNSRLGCW
jgi:hypothetical protein